MNRKIFHRAGLLFVHNWPYKLGALLAALLVWWFVTVNESPQTQASLFVPITTLGLSDDAVVTGLPDVVEVTIRGPSNLIDRLRPDNVEAVLDLAGRTGTFEAPINVLVPNGVELLRVSPRDIIGSLERVATRVVPVEAVVVGQQSPDTVLTLTAEPAELTLRGLGSTLERVSRVLAPVQPRAGDSTVQAFAVDSAGQPLPGVTIEPGSVSVHASESAVLRQVTLPVVLVPPSVPGFTVTARLDQPELTVTGPPSALAGLDSLNATVEFTVPEPQAGTYTLPVTPDLPAGVAIMGTATATVRLLQPLETQ
jgi:YbbR domain-containing protein